MTGTPVSLMTETPRQFSVGPLDVHDTQAAQEDGAVVPISVSRGLLISASEAERQALQEEFLANAEAEDVEDNNRNRQPINQA